MRGCDWVYVCVGSKHMSIFLLIAFTCEEKHSYENKSIEIGMSENTSHNNHSTSSALAVSP